MHRLLLIPLTLSLTVTACNNLKKPNDANFRKATNQPLQKHGHAGTWIGRPILIDISESKQKLQSGTGSQMAALEQAGLVRSSHMVTAALGMFDSRVPPRVKRYEPTEAGKRYLQQLHAVFGQSAGLFYGDKTVDSIAKWTEPVTMGAALRS